MKLALKYGIAVTVVIAAWVALKHFVLHFEGPRAQIADVGVFNLAAIAGLVLGIREKRRMNGGTLVFADGLITGIKIAVTYAILTSAYFAILLATLGPRMMQREGETSLGQAFAGVSIGFALIGTMLSSIISVILKRPYRAQGVDGWLLLFVVGQIVLRPIQAMNALSGATTTAAQIANRFPVTAGVMNLERILVIGSVGLGVVVAFSLLRTGHPGAVILAKVYLVANPIAAIVLTVLYYRSDLPEIARLQFIPQQFAVLIVSTFLSLVSFLYFTKFKRVRATYSVSQSSHAEPA